MDNKCINNPSPTEPNERIEELELEIEHLRNGIRNLEPLRDIDWHGKWRIHACLDALSNKDTGVYPIKDLDEARALKPRVEEMLRTQNLDAIDTNNPNYCKTCTSSLGCDCRTKT